MTVLRFKEAIRRGIEEEMARDPSVVLLGQDVTSGMHGTSGSLVDRFGPARVRDLPISELTNAGLAVGAALTGLRPVVDFTNASFLHLALDQIVNGAAKLRFLSGGQHRVPVVFRATLSYRGGNAAQHSDRPFAEMMNVPGLKVIAPSDPLEAKGLVKAAIRDDDPVVCFEDSNLGALKAEVPDDPELVMPLDRNRSVRHGSDVTVAAVAGSVRVALAAADRFARDGIELEVVAISSLAPLDCSAVLDSVTRTGRFLAVEPGNPVCGPAAELVATVAERRYGFLTAAPRRLTGVAAHPPYAPELEAGFYPTDEQICACVRELLQAPS